MRGWEKVKKKVLDVFDFKQEDEAVEKTSLRFVGKFSNPNKKAGVGIGVSTRVDKYRLLQSFVAGASDNQTKETSDKSRVEVNVISDDSGPKVVTGGNAAVDVDVDDDSDEDKYNCDDFKEGGEDRNVHGGEAKVFSGCSNVVNELFPSNNYAVNVDSDDDQSDPVNQSLNDDRSDPVNAFSNDDHFFHSSDMGEDQVFLEGWSEDHCSSGSEMENIEAAVVHPDYLIYGTVYCTDSSVMFCSSCIKVEGTNANGSKNLFTMEWGIDKLLTIESLWYARVETAIVTLYLTQTVDGGNANLGPVQLKFAVCDPCWSVNKGRILFLAANYRNVWRDLLPHGRRLSDDLTGERRKSYYPNFDEPFEDVVYPKGEPDAVSISRRDVELLQPERFVNDTVIDFYITYLKKNKIELHDRDRFHFFNSFFFRKLVDMDKDPASAGEGRDAFLRVRKWTRKVNLFEKDYVFIPVNFSLHWSLLVVCHPGEVANGTDEEMEKSRKVPCILHMDSIKGSHKGLKNLVQSYLWEEWRERHQESSEEVSSKFFNLRFVSLEVPQQENSFDCGLFLLHFVERFLEEAPVCFSPFRTTKSSSFLTSAWFPPGEASLKRVFIQRLIYKLLKDDSQNKLQATCYVQCLPSLSVEKDNEIEHDVEFHPERQTSVSACHDYASCSTANQGIEIKLLTASPDGSQFVRDSVPVIRELLQSGSSSMSVSDEQFQAFDQVTPFNRFKAVMSPLEEDESAEQFALIPSNGAVSLTSTGIAANACTSFTPRSFTTFEPLNSGISMPQDEDYSYGSSLETSSLGSQNSSEIGVGEHLSLRGFGCLKEQEEIVKPRSASPENVGCVTGSPASTSSDRLETCIVEDSQEVDKMPENDGSKDSLSSCQESIRASTYNQTASGENENHLGGDVQLSGDELASEAEEQPSKKLKLMEELNMQSARSVTMDLDS